MADADEVGDKETPLTRDDILFLKGNPQFQRFLEDIQITLARCRMEVDMIPIDRLNELQGRIKAYKQTLLIFEEIYDER